MTRSRLVAQSLSAEARAMSKKYPRMHVAVLVWQGEDSAIAVVHDEEFLSWDGVAARLKGTGEEIRQQLRSAK